jgi:hypothetical protein
VRACILLVYCAVYVFVREAYPCIVSIFVYICTHIHAYTWQALPAAQGKALDDSVLVYFHTPANCIVSNMLALFVDRRIKMIRTIGSGFAAIIFGDALECELARWQVCFHAAYTQLVCINVCVCVCVCARAQFWL